MSRDIYFRLLKKHALRSLLLGLVLTILTCSNGWNQYADSSTIIWIQFLKIFAISSAFFLTANVLIDMILKRTR